MDIEEIQTIRRQFQTGQWPQFLETLKIDGLRGWENQIVNFQFPVVALVGENGSGKSTVLKAAACLYVNSEDQAKKFYPSTFFVDTYWDKIRNVTLSFRVRHGQNNQEFNFHKSTKRWSIPEERRRPKRPVYFFDIARTLPLDASVGYAKIARITANDIATDVIDDKLCERLSHILGREYIKARFVRSDVDNVREVGLLERDFGEISQFHQGAGEDTTLDLFRILQSIPNYSLLIIDEVEASLHPRAQRRLVRFLMWLSRQKRAQIILSTHSPYVLQELPPEGRVLLLRSKSGIEIVNGISPEFAMSRIDEDMHPEINIFTEDREGSLLLREIIASHPKGPEIMPRISIVEVGPANVIQILGRLAERKRLPYKALGVVDGDQTPSSGCIKLPGDKAPERVVFEDLKKVDWPELSSRFGIGAGDLFTFLEDAMLDSDNHQWTKLVGNKILKSSTSVWEILANQWCKSCLKDDERDAIVDSIQNLLD
jgi:predicted ATPase